MCNYWPGLAVAHPQPFTRVSQMPKASKAGKVDKVGKLGNS